MRAARAFREGQAFQLEPAAVGDGEQGEVLVGVAAQVGVVAQNGDVAGDRRQPEFTPFVRGGDQRVQAAFGQADGCRFPRLVGAMDGSHQGVGVAVGDIDDLCGLDRMDGRDKQERKQATDRVHERPRHGGIAGTQAEWSR